MDGIQLQKEIQKLGGIREIYFSIGRLNGVFGKKKCQLLRDSSARALWHYNQDDIMIQEFNKKEKEISKEAEKDNYNHWKEYRDALQKNASERKDYINNSSNPYYQLKDGFILYLSKDDYSKSHASYFSPILVQAFEEIDKTFPYDNWRDLSEQDRINFEKEIINIFKKYDCIEKRESWE